MVQIKSQREIEKMRKSGKIVAQILSRLAEEAKPGVSLLDIDKIAASMAKELNATCAFKGYSGYPASVCTSVNEQVVHGIPTARVLKDGDVVGLDFGIVQDGFYGDSAVTVPIGTISQEASDLLRATAKSLYSAIEACRAGNTLKDIARGVEKIIKPLGYGIVREFVGHGIGQKLHEDPQIPNYEAGASNLVLKSGMTIAIEPMINLGSADIRILDDNWTAVTKDGKLSAHYEHTVLITDRDPEILTEWHKPRYGGLWD